MREMDLFGRKFKLVDDPSFPPNCLREYDDHEPVFERWCRSIQEGQTIIDAGGQYGNYTLPALAAGAHAIVYEPVASSRHVIKTLVECNGWQDRCIIREFALWDDTEYPLDVIGQVFSPHGLTRDTMKFVKLDDDLKALGVDKVHWLKSDTEGAEYNLLVGASETLERDRPGLMIEDHEAVSPDPQCYVSRYGEKYHTSQRIHEMLKALDYSIEVYRWDVSRRFIWAQQA